MITYLGQRVFASRGEDVGGALKALWISPAKSRPAPEYNPVFVVNKQQEGRECRPNAYMEFGTPIFQVLALQRTSKGLKTGGLDIDDAQVDVILDEDRKGLKTAADKGSELVQQAEREGFEHLSFFDQSEYQEKARQSKNAN